MSTIDLPPLRDPKGGSPKTPFPPMSASQLVEQEHPTIFHYPINGNGGIWRAIATGLGGLLVGMTIAWFTALQSRGVSEREMKEYVRENQADQEKHILTRVEMQDYVRDASPWAFDKQAVINRLAGHDQQLGELRTKIDLAADVIKSQHKP